MDTITSLLTPQSVKDAAAQQSAMLTQQQQQATGQKTLAAQEQTRNMTMDYFRRFGRSGTNSMPMMNTGMSK